MHLKIFKRLMPLVLAVAMVLGSVPSALAAGAGSITLTGATAGKSYSLYKVFDLTMAGAKPEDGVTYAIDADWDAFFFKGDAPTATGGAFITETVPTGKTLNQINRGGKTYYLNLTEANVAAFANAAQAYATGKAADKTVTATGDQVAFTGLDLGYYLVFPEGEATAADASSSVCSLTSTTPNATVNMKGEYPHITKTVDDADVEVGQTVNFTVTGKVPDTAGYSTYTYQITDTMSEGLTFGTDLAQTKLAVKFGDVAIPLKADATLAKDHYAVAFKNNGYVLTFDMAFFQGQKGKPITVTYAATVNDKAVVNYTHNDVFLEYGHDPNNLEKSTPIDVPVYSSRIVVDKYKAGANAEKLAGAKFALYRNVTKDGATKKHYYKFTPATATEAAKVEWVVEGENGAVPADATIVTTDDKGAAQFDGLESGDYFLQETAAPAGYSLLAAPVAVKVTAPQNDAAQHPVGVSVTKEVANQPAGTELPGTGGIGTTIFYATGAILVVGAGVLMFARRRTELEK